MSVCHLGLVPTTRKMFLQSLLAFAALVAASPITPVDEYAALIEQRDDISVQDYSSLKFYVQHAAAAYCNFNTPPGQPIVCQNSACPLVQQDQPTVVASFVGQFTGIGAYVAVDNARQEIVLSVRGSNNIRNFITDLIFAWQACDFAGNCRVHTGFAESWKEIQDAASLAITAALGQNPGFRVVATGHSLGGAVATLGAAYLRQQGLSVDLYTYGAPRVGNEDFANWMTSQPGGQWRVTHDNDPVPRLPPIFFGYRHLSPEYWLANGQDAQNDYPIGQVQKCMGIANTACNGGTFGLDVVAHLHYLTYVSACTGFPLKWKRGDPSDEELEQRLNAWSQKDQDLTK